MRDNFTTVAYTNNDGTVNWAGNWTETNDDNNANAGQIRITVVRESRATEFAR